MTAGTRTDVLFVGPGTMRRECRDLDWSSTQLGDSAQWPQSLRTAVQLTLANPGGAIVLWGDDLVQIYNDAYRELMGDKHPAGLGQPTRECWPEVWYINEPIYDRVLAGETLSFEDALFPIMRTGVMEDAWFSLSYMPVADDAGRIAGILITVRETTKSRIAEEQRDQSITTLNVERDRMRNAFRKAPSFMAILRGQEMRFEFVNEAHTLLFGLREVIGKAFLEALPELEDQGFLEVLRNVLDTGETWIGRELSILIARTAGAPEEIRFVDMVYYVMTEADGSRSGVVAHGSDVTERVLAHIAVEKLFQESEGARQDAVGARQVAETANIAKGRFLAVMSHELRTPLNAIGGYASLMELGIRGPVSAEQLNDLARIQSCKSHLLGLINEVLDFAKLETRTLQYEHFDMRARDVLLSAVTLVEPQVNAKSLTLTIEQCADSLMIRADRDKVRQVLTNMLSNAVKFTPSGGAIDLRCERVDAKVYFIVKDSGIGIPADQLSSIFEPYVQVSTDRARSQEGTGLGLAISRELARGMGGDLEVSSIFSQGSQFLLSLPAA